MTDRATVEAALIAARPRAIAALFRAFRDLDTAEEAFQEASFRAVERWADTDAPADPTAWLVLVGRNATFDAKRRSRRQTGLEDLPTEPSPGEADPETSLVSRLDDAEYKDDVLRLLFVCCHPELPPAQQIAPAFRVVCGLSVKEIARAFLVSESALEQRITRAMGRIAEERYLRSGHRPLRAGASSSSAPAPGKAR